MSDILYKTNEGIFSYRVGGILEINNKILLQKPKNDDYAIIGGHVNFGETGEEALQREYKEELHVDIKVEKLVAVGEIFFKWGKPCHQISLYYDVSLKDKTKLPLDGVISGYDELNNKQIDLDFCWVEIEDLKNGLKVYPQELIPYLVKKPKGIIHFVSKE